jgi:hypothetical protein
MSSDGKPLKRKRRRRWLTAALVVLSVLILTISVLFVFRFDLWRDHAGIRWVVRPLILADPSVRGSSKVELRLLLGPPDVIEGRYCWFPRELGQMTGDLRFDIGDSNEVTQIRFVWRDWKPTAEIPIDLESWKDQPEAGRWAMNADLMRRWPSGAFRREIETVTDVLRYFPGAVFIDYWQFASDGGGGLGGSLDFEFEPDGRVKDVRCGYID